MYYYEGHLKQLSKQHFGRGNGIHLEFDTTGVVILEGHLRNDESDGIWRTYDSRGSLIRSSAVWEGHLLYDTLRESFVTIPR